MKNGKLETTMQINLGPQKPNPAGDRDDLYDQNPCPVFSKPHDKGPDTIPVVMEEGENGRRYHGSIKGIEAKISSPMQRSKP